MRFAVTLLFLLATAPVVAQIRMPLPEPAEPDPATTTKPPPTAQFRATLINRCPDANGSIILQDTPCTPTRAAAASAVPEVTDLSALTPRPTVDLPPALAQDAGMGAIPRGLINGAWKLALLVLGGYALVRLLRFARDAYRERFAPVETPSHGPRRVR